MNGLLEVKNQCSVTSELKSNLISLLNDQFEINADEWKEYPNQWFEPYRYFGSYQYLTLEECYKGCQNHFCKAFSYGEYNEEC